MKWKQHFRIMCGIPSTWYDSSTVIFTVEEFCQYRKKKKFCPWLLKNRASHCWTIVPVTVEELYQWQLNNRASQCWVIVPVIGEQSFQWLVNNCATDSSTSKCPRDNVCSEIAFRVSSYQIESSQLITTGDKLAGFSMVRILLKCIYEQSVNNVRKCFSVDTCALQKPVNWFAV